MKIKRPTTDCGCDKKPVLKVFKDALTCPFFACESKLMRGLLIYSPKVQSLSLPSPSVWLVYVYITRQFEYFNCIKKTISLL